MVLRKIIRLDHGLYADPNAIISTTIVVADRKPIFRDAALAEAVHREFASHLMHHGVSGYAWTIMPDHTHLCCSPTSSRTLMDIVGGIKQRTMRIAWTHGVRGGVWQRSFYDHFLRHDEDIETVCRYIWNNPVRAGLVEHWKAWPYNGSTVYNLSRLP